MALRIQNVLVVSVVALGSSAVGACEASRNAPKSNPPLAPVVFDHKALPLTQVVGRVLYQYTSTVRPRDLRVIGNYVVVLNGNQDDRVVVQDKTNGHIVAAFGTTGNRPGQFLGVWSIAASAQTTTGRGMPQCWIYDLELRRLTGLTLGGSAGAQLSSPISIISLRASATTTGPEWINESTMVSAGTYDSGRLAYFDKTGKQLREVGPVPPGAPDVPPSVRQHAYQSTLLLSPDGTRLALLTRYAGGISFFKATGELIDTLDGPYGFAPLYHVASNGMRPVLAMDDDYRFGYIGGTATKHAIFALFSGRTWKGFGPRANSAAYIHVFDWSGRFHGAIELGHDIGAISIDPTTNIIYALRTDTAALLEYAIPDSLEPHQ